MSVGAIGGGPALGGGGGASSAGGGAGGGELGGLLGIGMILGGLSLSGIAILKRGREKYKQAKWEAEQRLLEAGYIGEDMKRKTGYLARASKYTQGTALGTISKAGVKAGTGSTDTMMASIEQSYAEAMLEVTIPGFRKIKSLTDQSKELRRRGREAERQSWWEFGADIFSKLFSFAALTNSFLGEGPDAGGPGGGGQGGGQGGGAGGFAGGGGS